MWASARAMAATWAAVSVLAASSAVFADPPFAGSGLVVWHDVAGVAAAFAPGGEARFSGDRWMFSLTPVAFGPRQAPARLVPPVRTIGAGTVDFDHGGLVAWYRTATEGVEQGFTVPAPPPSSGNALRVVQRLSGNLLPTMGEDTVVLVGLDGVARAAYEKLLAFDDTGRRLAASMTLVDDTLVIDVDTAGAAFPVTIDPVIRDLQAKLLPQSVPPDLDVFGYDVAVDGDTAVVGSPYEVERDGTTTVVRDPDDAVYVYVRRGDSWLREAILQPDPPPTAASTTFAQESSSPSPSATPSPSPSPDSASRSSMFGISVAIDGDVAVVGTDGEEAYVFERGPDGWEQTAQLTAPVRTEDRNFGRAVAVAGDLVAVGARNDRVPSGRDDVRDQEAGAVYLFVRDGDQWQRHGERLTSDATRSSEDDFGASVAVDLVATTSTGGDYLVVVGSPRDAEPGDSAFQRKGSVYAFDVHVPLAEPADVAVDPGSVWYAASADAMLGADVAVDGETVVAGAPGDDQAYVFTRRDGEWSEQVLDEPVEQDPAPFGAAVAVGGGFIVVGALSSFDATVPGYAHVFTSIPLATGPKWTEQQRLEPGQGSDGDEFGATVAVAGGTLFVGAPYADSAGRDRGAVSLFTMGEDEVFRETQKLVRVSPQEARLGFSTDIDGDTAVLGAYSDDEAGDEAGAAYVFQREAEVWRLQAKLLPPPGSEGDTFGWSVAISGDTIVAGAPRDDDDSDEAGANAGAVHVFMRDGRDWFRGPRLTPPPGSGGSNFGWRVALDDATLAVGAPQDREAGGPAGGAVYVYGRDGVEFSSEQKLVREYALGELFGESVAVDGATLVAGAPWHDTRDVGGNEGAVFVFTRQDDGRWAETAQLDAGDDARQMDELGRSVALHQDVVLAGAPLYDLSSEGQEGAVFVFTRTNDGWVAGPTLTAAEGASGDRFGAAAAFDGKTAVVGTPSADAFGDGAGAAYVFAADDGSWTQVARLGPTGAEPEGDLFGASVAVDGERAVVGAYEDATLAFASGAGYVFAASPPASPSPSPTPPPSDPGPPPPIGPPPARPSPTPQASPTPQPSPSPSPRPSPTPSSSPTPSASPTPSPRARFAVTPRAIDFGDVPVGGRSAEHAVTVTNQGDGDGNIRGVGLVGAQTRDFLVEDACTGRLAAGDSCALRVTFAPTDSGVRHATVQVDHDGEGRALTVALEGVGGTVGLSLSPAVLDLGATSVGVATEPRTLSVSNTGSQETGVLEVAVAQTGEAFLVTTDGCTGQRLDPSASCTVAIRFHPQTSGDHTAVLTVTDPEGGERASAELRGLASDVPLLRADRLVLRVGRVVHLQGLGFPAGAPVIVGWARGGVAVATTARPDGTFSVALLALRRQEPGRVTAVAMVAPPAEPTIAAPDDRPPAATVDLLLVAGTQQPLDFVSRR